jgi:hypothetical protein
MAWSSWWTAVMCIALIAPFTTAQTSDAPVGIMVDARGQPSGVDVLAVRNTIDEQSCEHASRCNMTVAFHCSIGTPITLCVRVRAPSSDFVKQLTWSSHDTLCSAHTRIRLTCTLHCTAQLVGGN